MSLSVLESRIAQLKKMGIKIGKYIERDSFNEKNSKCYGKLLELHNAFREQEEIVTILSERDKSKTINSEPIQLLGVLSMIFGNDFQTIDNAKTFLSKTYEKNSFPQKMMKYRILKKAYRKIKRKYEFLKAQNTIEVASLKAKADASAEQLSFILNSNHHSTPNSIGNSKISTDIAKENAQLRAKIEDQKVEIENLKKGAKEYADIKGQQSEEFQKMMSANQMLTDTIRMLKAEFTQENDENHTEYSVFEPLIKALTSIRDTLGMDQGSSPSQIAQYVTRIINHDSSPKQIKTPKILKSKVAFDIKEEIEDLQKQIADMKKDLS